MRRFWKMHGAGNDFVLLDARGGDAALSRSGRERLCDRRFGLGCDQLIEVHQHPDVDTEELYFYNQDGTATGACGNGTRCAAWWLLQNQTLSALQVSARRLAVRQDSGRIWINMGAADFAAQRVPMIWDGSDSLCDLLVLEEETLVALMACSFGNPHLVLLWSEPPENSVVARLGVRLEKHAIFPENANIGFLHITGDGLGLRVWERGVGESLACGSGACAAFAVARKLEVWTQEGAEITLPGGVLQIAAEEDDLWMSGAVVLVAEGVWYD